MIDRTSLNDWYCVYSAKYTVCKLSESPQYLTEKAKACYTYFSDWKRLNECINYSRVSHSTRDGLEAKNSPNCFNLAYSRWITRTYTRGVTLVIVETVRGLFFTLIVSLVTRQPYLYDTRKVTNRNNRIEYSPTIPKAKVRYEYAEAAKLHFRLLIYRHRERNIRGRRRRTEGKVKMLVHRTNEAW